MFYMFEYAIIAKGTFWGVGKCIRLSLQHKLRERQVISDVDVLRNMKEIRTF